MRLVVSIPEWAIFSWESQAQQYEPSGEPGYGYFRADHTVEDWIVPGTWIDCLLWYDELGTLSGILNHYPFDMTYEQAGNVNLWVSPHHRHQGIATRLLAEAERRWGPINWEQQRYTAAGANLVAHYLRHRAQTD